MINHSDSAGKMESDGMVEIFKRSEEKNNAKYAFYIGDGDSKSFAAIVDSKPYKDLVPIKKESVNHVSKRLFHRLTETKKRKSQADKAIQDHEQK